MAQSSLFSKIFSSLRPKASEKTSEASASPKPAINPEHLEAIFADRFVTAGGKFIFCEHRDEVIKTLQDIFAEEQIETLSCNDPLLQTLVREAGILQPTDLSKNADAAFITCELLIASNGGIMVTANQTYHIKIQNLPNTIIVLGNTSQIIDKLNNALTHIKAKYPPKEIPSMITTLKGPKGDGLEDPNSAFSTKNIYLLLTV
ncbi:hypothetical protein JCM31826_06020 [Thermaurantimonas aggregans]|uniref:LUD domain-containing protein n=1 Tax=Thermaurantimonas aggregans TaxID=2173829 RepID=A0A401XJE6_9FLAO|nr:LUD domain-containing protein [Thermaurantimonas aggregans]MCX8148656.1 hypothetical protein [Thermaurantimonas aggregans]GCD77120.1 hypothetical protein JCM31826_06020 [Thermaurantimonas aggregans]